jgi:hypothetical protein
VRIRRDSAGLSSSAFICSLSPPIRANRTQSGVLQTFARAQTSPCTVVLEWTRVIRIASGYDRATACRTSGSSRHGEVPVPSDIDPSQS